MAQLQKQLEIKKEGETLDDAIEHIKGLLPEWRDKVLDMRMEEGHLIDLMVELHKVDVEYETKHNTTQKPKREGDVNKTKVTYQPKVGERRGFIIQS